MANVFGKWTICDFIGTLPPFDTAVLTVSDAVGDELYNHLDECNRIRCIAGKRGHAVQELRAQEMKEDCNARITLLGKSLSYKEYEMSLVERYRQFCRALEYFKQHPQYTTICELMANAPAEEISILTGTVLIAGYIEHHAGECEQCWASLETVLDVDWEKLPENVQRRLDAVAQQDGQGFDDESAPEKKFCTMVASMNTDELQTLLFNSPVPEETVALKKHAETCGFCRGKIDEINFLRSLDDELLNH